MKLKISMTLIYLHSFDQKNQYSTMNSNDYNKNFQYVLDFIDEITSKINYNYEEITFRSLNEEENEHTLFFEKSFPLQKLEELFSYEGSRSFYRKGERYRVFVEKIYTYDSGEIVTLSSKRRTKTSVIDFFGTNIEMSLPHLESCLIRIILGED